MWQDRWLETIGGPIYTSVEILTLLHTKQYPLYALTNFAAETFFTHIRHDTKYNFLNLFKDIVVSGVEKVIKPDPKIYEILLQRNNLDPKNCIYIDDSKNNLVPAQELGMTTIHFISSEKLTNEFRSLNILL
jgi:2-haloacid dehalogenase